MNFYFELDFLSSITNIELDREASECLRRFLKKLSDVNIYILVSTENSCKLVNKEILMTIPLYHELTELDTRRVIEISISDLENVVADESTTGFKFFFLKHRTDLSYITEDYGYFLATELTLNRQLRFFDDTRDDVEKYISKETGRNKFNSWKVLNEFAHPINSIVISDRYVYDNEEEVEINIHELLRNVGLKPLKKRMIDIFIVSENYFTKVKNTEITTDNNKDTNTKSRFDLAFNSLVIFFDKEIGSDKYNLTLIKVDAKCPIKPTEIHSRILFTNTIRFKCGTSFTFFKKKAGRIVPKANEFFNIDFFHWPKIRNAMKEHLELLSSVFYKIQDRQKIGSEEPIQRVKIKNDKKCRLLYERSGYSDQSEFM